MLPRCCALNSRSRHQVHSPRPHEVHPHRRVSVSSRTQVRQGTEYPLLRDGTSVSCAQCAVRSSFSPRGRRYALRCAARSSTHSLREGKTAAVVVVDSRGDEPDGTVSVSREARSIALASSARPEKAYLSAVPMGQSRVVDSMIVGNWFAVVLARW